MNSFRPESDVAHQIRRDKLRIHNSSSSSSSLQHFQEFPNNNLEQYLSLHPEFNLDLLQVRSVRNANNIMQIDDHPPLYSSSEMPNFSTQNNPLPAPRNALEYQEVGAAEPSRLLMIHQQYQYGSFPHTFPSPQKEQCEELRDLGNWRNSTGPHQVSDWIVNYGSNNTNPSLANELNNVGTYHHNEKHSHNEQFGNAYGELGVMHHTPVLYQNALQDIVKSASISGHGNRVGDATATELELQPSHENQPMNQLRFGWKNRSDSSNPQSLSLSLSSNAQSKACLSQFEEGSASDQDLRCLKHMKSFMKPSIISRGCDGKSLQDIVGIMPYSKSTCYRNVGPLGPFTGYATILKSSRFLKTCQQLLDEFCCISGPKLAKTCDISERVVSREVSIASTSASAADTVTVNETGVASRGSNSCSSSSMLYISNENSADWGPGSSHGGVSLQPDYQQKKAKLLYMQEEVTRRYKQYHQQMQMVVSSFESVSGLSSATPYISLALKSVSKHFRCLNNSISGQLNLISEVLGEDLSIPNTSTSSKVDTNMARLRGMDQSFQKNKPCRGSTTGLLDPQQHVWRPQRGFPERSVAILRAWLFEHFLHPYPTDTDKHMLATQTGLSRNQVSNWFINARVRVWKPMVEEIHTLETKTPGAANEGTSGTEGGSSQPRVDKPLSKFGIMHSIPEKQFQGMELGSSIDANSSAEESKLTSEQWSQEKRSKLECQMTPTSMDGTLMGFLPYRRGGIEGLGSVSLTLGLRHGVESVQHHQQQQLQEEQLRHHLGGQMMIHDFVG